ncbi:hypothetical protein F0562_003910 [Nyssa sinensis]|uniref:HTH myb-type domain-containing protein n=1 Tax=Nyssa sinensis TaxID=561372 RepID=A0A5J5BXA1_9ASTE|nr:hypothetical protein F0562_003910 [Nyssa sinensis]
MGENSPELNLDSSPFPVPKTISDFLTEISVIEDFSEKSLKLRNYVRLLEDELRKIDGFKRELPLCMLLLNDALMRLKEEKMQYAERETEVPPVMEEFIPSKPNSDEDEGAKMSSDCSDKMNWMSTAQLWSTNKNCDNNDIKNKDLSDEEEDRSAINNSFELCDIGNRGGAFVPFRSQPNLVIKENEDKEVLQVGGSLSTPVAEMGFIDFNLENKGEIGGCSSLVTGQTKSGKQPQQRPQQKKNRRCWSPELHRRFVDALQHLGGPQVATPKQIREIMQVDGLTNDEVKSHLQKYRLHVRKLPASSAGPSNSSWLTRDQYESMLKANIAYSDSPQGPLPLAWYGKRFSLTGCDSMEDEEDEKSEIHSWTGRLHI